jgi:hypothetical protein
MSKLDQELNNSQTNTNSPEKQKEDSNTNEEILEINKNSLTKVI